MESKNNVPVCVGIIMDGNRRWGRHHGMSALEGYDEGARAMERVARHIFKQGVEHLAVFAFSYENWQRPPEEVAYLMEMVTRGVREHLLSLQQEGIRIRFIGDRRMIPQRSLEAIESIETSSKHLGPQTIWVCFSYGGKQEIVDAARTLARSQQDITAESLKGAMWAAEMPDPDIVIRTSGEQRLSNFLLWHIAYSELFFVDKHWPDFNEADFDAILKEYAQRERRHGK